MLQTLGDLEEVREGDMVPQALKEMEDVEVVEMEPDAEKLPLAE